MSMIPAATSPTGAEARAVRSEFRAASRERMIQRLDQDGSGGVSRQEFARVLQNLPGGGNTDRAGIIVTQLDADGDGQVSAGELDRAFARRDAARRAGGMEEPATAALDLIERAASPNGGLAQTQHRAAAQYAQASRRIG